MSAVMSTLSLLGGGRRAHRKLAHSSARVSGQWSDAGERRAASDLQPQQRSSSLQTLENSGAGAGVVNLETLEAKMASIEVSLGGRRAAPRDIDALRAALHDKDTLIQSLKKQLSASLSAARLSQWQHPGGGGGGGALSAEERRALAERLAAVRAELAARAAALHDLRDRLERTHVTDNIDSRIQQAELQYQAGREELELQALREQARALHALLEQQHAPQHQQPLYPVVRSLGGAAMVVAAEARAGSWRARLADGALLLDRVKDNCALHAGDRVVEVNGVPVASSAEAQRAAAGGAGGADARLLVLRHLGHHQQGGGGGGGGEDAAAERLRADNTRLTHRISYLEEQVAELLARHQQLQPVSSSDSCITVNKTKKNVTNISITSEQGGGERECQLQVFQKGPDITALVATASATAAAGEPLPPLRPRSNASGASSRAAPSPRASPAPPPRAASAQPRPRDYASETDAALRMIERNQRHLQRARRCPSADDRPDRPDRSPADRYHIAAATDRIHESIKKTNWAERKTLSIIEQIKRSQRSRKMKKNESAEDVRLESEKHFIYHRIDGKVLENAHKCSRRTSKLHTRSAKSSEMESEYSDYPSGELYHSTSRLECDSEGGAARPSRYRKHEERERADGDGRARPTPPRKPLRLSLHKARSAHSLNTGSETEPALGDSGGGGGGGKKPVKRTHAQGGGGGGKEGGSCARATPRPARRAHAALSAPAADALYPDTHRPQRWC